MADLDRFAYCSFCFGDERYGELLSRPDGTFHRPCLEQERRAEGADEARGVELVLGEE